MSPRDLPARREPKLPATVSLSGSGAPSNLRLVAAVTGRPGGFGSPEGAPIACRPPARLAALRGGGAPLRPTRRCAAEGRTRLRPCGVCLAREAPLPASRPSSAPRSPASGLAAFVGSPGSVSAFRRLRNLVRSPRVGASTAWSEANCTGGNQAWSTRRFRRSEHECAGSGHRKKSDKSERTVTNATANDERAGQRWYASTSSYTDTI